MTSQRSPTTRSGRFTPIALGLCFVFGTLAIAQPSSSGSKKPDASKKNTNLFREALKQVKTIDMSVPGADGRAIELIEHPLLRHGDTARDNKKGTLWAWGSKGRPLAVAEMYQGVAIRASWTYAITLTSTQRVAARLEDGRRWTPRKTQVEFKDLPDGPRPVSRSSTRLRQMKALARRFSAHEFWNPNNSRYELRLLVQPVHRYLDKNAGILDGTLFVLAHGTNPEVILLIELQGKDLESATWRYACARLGSAELHVMLDDREVWKQGRTPRVVGAPTDPYWLFFTKRKAKVPPD